MASHLMSRKFFAAPVIRFRHVAAIVVLLATGIAAPLTVVWKESWVTRLSRDHKACADSVAALRREAERLRLSAQALSQTTRIEEFARLTLGLEYPSLQQIIIVPASDRRPASEGSRWEFLAILRKSLTKGRG